MAELPPEELKTFLADYGLTESGAERLIRTTYHLLGLISFLTAGEEECRAWTITRGTNAQRAAGVIHSDLEDHFIRAEVCALRRLREVWKHAGAEREGTATAGRQRVRRERRGYHDDSALGIEGNSDFGFRIAKCGFRGRMTTIGTRETNKSICSLRVIRFIDNIPRNKADSGILGEATVDDRLLQSAQIIGRQIGRNLEETLSTKSRLLKKKPRKRCIGSKSSRKR